MANREVGLPRFYIDLSQLARVLGLWESSDRELLQSFIVSGYDDSEYSNPADLFLGDYSTPKIFKKTEGSEIFQFHMTFFENEENANKDWVKLVSGANWFGIMNHNMREAFKDKGNLEVAGFVTGEVENNNILPDINYIDETSSSHQELQEYNGYTIVTDANQAIGGLDIDNDSDIMDYRRFCFKFVSSYMPEQEFKIGSLMFGKYIDMPHSPDLKLTRSVEFDGIDVTRGISGADFTTIQNTGIPSWQHGDCWKNIEYNNVGQSLNLGSSGRRRWNLKFSYISQSNMFSSHHADKSFGTVDAFNNFSNNSNGSVELLYQLTLGGALPFLFTPDQNAAEGEKEFAICRFAKDSLTCSQTAHNVWDIRMDIEEIW